MTATIKEGIRSLKARWLKAHGGGSDRSSIDSTTETDNDSIRSSSKELSPEHRSSSGDFGTKDIIVSGRGSISLQQNNGNRVLQRSNTIGSPRRANGFAVSGRTLKIQIPQQQVQQPQSRLAQLSATIASSSSTWDDRNIATAPDTNEAIEFVSLPVYPRGYIGPKNKITSREQSLPSTRGNPMIRSRSMK